MHLHGLTYRARQLSQVSQGKRDGLLVLFPCSKACHLLHFSSNTLSTQCAFVASDALINQLCAHLCALRFAAGLCCDLVHVSPPPCHFNHKNQTVLNV